MIDAFSEFKELKNIGHYHEWCVLKESFHGVIARCLAPDEYDVIVNRTRGTSNMA